MISPCGRSPTFPKRRNPMASVLRFFKPKIVKSKKKYTRKRKHHAKGT